MARIAGGRHAAAQKPSDKKPRLLAFSSSLLLILTTVLSGASPAVTGTTDALLPTMKSSLEGQPVSAPIVVSDAGTLSLGDIDFSVSLSKNPVTSISALLEEETRRLEEEQASPPAVISSSSPSVSPSSSQSPTGSSSGSSVPPSPPAQGNTDKNAPLGSGQHLTFYMSPNGDNNSEGTDISNPIADFTGVQQIINNNPNTNIDIVVLGGQYSVGDNELTVALNGNRLSVRGEGNPVFIGNGGVKMYWLDILVKDGSSVQVEGITVKNYANGLRIGGGYDYKKVGQAARGVYAPVKTPVVKNMRFENIGDQHSSGSGYAAVHLQNVQDPYILNNTFNNITNSARRASYIHAVYAVLSKDTRVRGNDFSGVSGDPVRFRHASSGEVSGNSFRNAGQTAHVSDWFCDAACAKRSSQSYECPSHSISVSKNRLDGLREWTRTVSPAAAWSGC